MTDGSAHFLPQGTGEQSLEEFKEMELLLMEEEINCISVSFSEVPEIHSEVRPFPGPGAENTDVMCW